MKQFFRGSIARRAALNVIAACALLLQALSPVAMSVAAINSKAPVICSNDASRSGAPKDEHHHSGFCCVLACATYNFAYIATTSGAATFPPRNVSSLHWDLSNATATGDTLKFNFSARGPPNIV